MTKTKLHAAIFVLMLLLLIAGGGWLIFSFTKTSADPELQMGLLVVFAITSLMTVLFIVAAGFSSMELTDAKQALGLPEGSIRAMIALVLIMVFIIFGIYLFRKVATGDTTFAGTLAEVPESMTLAGKPIVAQPHTGGGFDVWFFTEVSDDAKRLAQQLITTVGTLVVAVAGFYFGSTITTSAAKKEREEIAAVQAVSKASNPVITDVTPREASKGAQVDLQIAGTDFRSPKTVRLVRGDEIITGTEILSNRTTIRCKVLLDKEPGSKWDLVVENEDGKEAKIPQVFAINGR